MNRVITGGTLSVSALLAPCWLTSNACRGEILTSGAIQFVDPPASVESGATEDDFTILAFAEQQKVTLESDTQVDVGWRDPSSGRGTPPRDADLVAQPGLLPAGSLVDSYFFHFDPIGRSQGFAIRALGTASFPTEIVGLVFRLPTLRSTGVFALADTDYGPATGSGDQLEFLGLFPVGEIPDGITTPRDALAVSADRRTLYMDLGATAFADHLRVLVRHVPEASCLTSAGIAALLLAVRRRRHLPPRATDFGNRAA